MNWPDERYVRVYTRDTTDWLGLSWQAQGLFCLLLRKVDRAGLLDLGKQGNAGLASHIGGPSAWRDMEPALDELLRDGCVEVVGTSLVIRNFIEAQEAKQSDKVRQAESRNRRRDQVRHESPVPVTNRDISSRNVTERHARSQGVTDGHTASQSVTPSCAVPNRAVPSCAVPIAEPTSSAATEPMPEAFRLEAQATDEAKPRKLSPAQSRREQLRAIRAAALPGVVDDTELKPAAVTRIFDRLEQEATAKGSDIVEAYSAFLRDDYALSRNPPCPLGLFVDGNKYRECLSAALRARGKGPALTLVSNRKAGSYASLAEIEAQDFTVDPVDDAELTNSNEEAQ